MTYDASDVYAELIEPRYAPIADALVAAASLGRTDDALELGAGTGLVTRRAAARVRRVTATDAARGMLERARESMRGAANVSYQLLDYSEPFPFLDGSFSVVLSGLTFVQNSSASLGEIARVLGSGGRLALSMWGPRYHEKRLLNAAVRSIGGPPFPAAAPGRAVARLERLGFRSVRRVDVDISNTFGSIGEYLSYRRGFGRPVQWTPAFYERFLRAVAHEASRSVARDGSFALGWTITILTARAPRQRRTILTPR